MEVWLATPEEKARQEIDTALTAAGWLVQDVRSANLYAAQGVAIREVVLKPGHGKVDYLLFVDQLAVGGLEAKKVPCAIRASRRTSACAAAARCTRQSTRPSPPACAPALSTARIPGRLHFWPFDGFEPAAGKAMVAEVYPALFKRRYRKTVRWKDHKLDAFSVCRWLQSLDQDDHLARYLNPPITDEERDIASREGWILGVA
jgi:hypothetical protein